MMKTILCALILLSSYVLVVEAGLLFPISWRWMSGMSITKQNGVCGAAGHFSLSHAPGSRQRMAITVAHDGVSYVFGGDGYPTSGAYGAVCSHCTHVVIAGRLGDVWAYRQTGWSGRGEWAWLGGKSDSKAYKGEYSGSNQYPGGRAGMIAWQMPDDEKLYAFGGYGYADTFGYLSDLWSFSTSSFVWTFLKGSSTPNSMATFGTFATPAAGNIPGSVRYHMLLRNTKTGTVWMFGGRGYDATSMGYLADTWRYTHSTNNWAWVNGPTIRGLSSAGGESGVYDAVFHPGGRSQCTAMGSSSHVYVYGGEGQSSSTTGRLADLWAYDTSSDQWAYIAGESSATSGTALPSYGTLNTFAVSHHPGSRQFAPGWADPNSDLLCVFGGWGYDEASSGGFLNDFWAFNATDVSWAWAGGDSVVDQTGHYTDSVWFSTANKPGARYDAAAGEDSALGVMYLMGGEGYAASGTGAKLNDVWTTRGPSVFVGPSPTSTVTPTPTPTPTVPPTGTLPTPSLHTSSAYAAGIVVSVTAAVVVGVPSIVTYVQGKEIPSSVWQVVDALQFIAITSQLSVQLPDAYKDFASAFSWTLPAISGPFEVVGGNLTTVPIPQRRLMDLEKSLGSVLGCDGAARVALSYLPYLLFWSVLAFIVVVGCVVVVDGLRRLLKIEEKTVAFWWRSMGVYLRFLIISFYAICVATLYALSNTEIALSVALGVFFAAILSLLCLCFGLPILCGVVLRRISASPDLLKSPHFTALFGSFYTGLKLPRYWFAVALFTQKFFVAFLLVIQTVSVQIPLLLCVHVLMTFTLYKWKPFVSPLATTLWVFYSVLQTMGIVVLFITSFFTASMDKGTSDSVSAANSILVGLALAVLIALCVRSFTFGLRGRRKLTSDLEVRLLA